MNKQIAKYNFNRQELFWLIAIVCTIIFLFAFNLYKLDDFIIPDAVVERVFAKTMWREKSLFPKSWYHSTEPQNFRLTVITAVLWGITGNMQIAHSVALLFVTVCIAITFYYMLSGLKVVRLSTILMGIELLIAGFGWMFSAWYFIIDGRYAFIMISMFILSGFLLRAYHKKLHLRDRFLTILIFGILGIIGPRSLLYTLFPFFLVCFCIAIHEHIKQQKKIIVSGSVLAEIILPISSNIIGLFLYIIIFSHSDKVPVDTANAAWVSAGDFIKNIADSLSNCLQIVGIDGSAKLLSIHGVDILCKIGLLAATIYFAVYFQNYFQEDEKFLILQYMSSSIITIFFCSALSITGNGQAQNQAWYYYSVVYTVVITVVVLIGHISNIKIINKLLQLYLIIAIVINLYHVYIMRLNQDNNVSEKKVAQYLIENNYHYGYAPYNSAYMIQAASQEHVEMVSLISDFAIENADMVDIWYFNLDKNIVQRAQNSSPYIVILTDTEESKMLENNNSILYAKANNKLAEIDNYNVYTFSQLPFSYAQ